MESNPINFYQTGLNKSQLIIVESHLLVNLSSKSKNKRLIKVKRHFFMGFC